MTWFANLSARAKLFLGFGIMWLLLAVVIAIAYSEITNIAQSEKEMHEVSLVSVLNFQELRSGVHYIRGQVLEMALAAKRPEQEAIEKNIREYSPKIDEMVERLSKVDLDAQGQGRLKELKATLAAYHQTKGQAIALIYQGKVEEARQLVLGVQDERYEKIRAIAAELRQRESDKLQKRIDQDMQEAKWSLQLFLILGVAAFLLGTTMIGLLNRTMAKPLKAIAAVATRIAAGDLTVEVAAENGRTDEVGALAQTFGQMAGNLRRSTAEISQAINLLGASASEILAATTQVASGTAEAAAAISQTTTTVEEVRQAAQLSAKKAKDVSANAQGVAEVAQRGEKAVEEAAAGMRRIREEMESIARTIVLLSEQGQSIGGIIATVTDLADQSNLLAVNAAIEAAKAGEQGRGFAVVAQEIKSLAEQSKQATAQVRGILSDIQKATSAAVMATEQGSKAVEAGVKQSAQAGEAIRVLAESSGRAAQAATQISVSSQQQGVGMDQVGLAMENINQAGSQTAASMKQLETAAQNLNQLGQDLKRLVKQYKV